MTHEVLAWSIDLGNGHFVGRFWGADFAKPPRNYSGYRSAVFETRREARECLKTVRVPYGFPQARVIRVRVMIRRAAQGKE